MKRKITSFLLILAILVLSLGILTACKPDDDGEKDPFAEYRKEEGFTYYQEMVMNPDKKLYVFNRSESLSAQDRIVAEAIQGIYARTNAKFFYFNGKHEVWLAEMEKDYGITSEDITFDEMTEMFKQNYGNKYVLYDGTSNPESLNVACMIAGAKDLLPVDVTNKEAMEARGFTMEVDARNMTEAECFEQYKEFLNNDGIVQISNEGFNDQMRDYGIACKYLFMWPKDMNDPGIVKFRASALQWAKPDSPIFGWVPNDEAIDVNIASTSGKFTLASDFCTNMSVYTCKKAFGDLVFKQNNKETDIVAEQGKHYVCIMMSDGDNVQTWYNNFPLNEQYYAAERGDFPMGWSIQPSLSDLAPNIMDYVYKRQDKNDYFVCSVSGHGYMNPMVYPYMDSFIGGLESYLQRTDLSVVQILDSGPNAKAMEMYSKIPSMKGAIYCYGMKYAGGAGSVFWKNDKPFVTIRETLWDADVKAMAQRINSYAKDPTTIDGYTAINLHPWSMDYSDVKELVSLLDDDVVVVTADDFIRLITENVPHEDVVKS